MNGLTERISASAQNLTLMIFAILLQKTIDDFYFRVHKP